MKEKSVNKCKILFLIAMFFLSFIFFNIFLSSFMFIFKVSVNAVTPIVSIILSVLLNLFINNKNCDRGDKNRNKIIENILITVIPICIICVATIINGKVIDYTFDGNSYQKGTAGLLAKGWNPLYENVETFEEKSTLKIVIRDENPKYMNHYAKATNLFAANIYKLTGNIETGKMINTISLIMIFLFTISFLMYKKRNIIFTILFSLCVATYPVASAQFLTNYLDILVYVYLYLIIFSFFTFEEENFMFDKNTLLAMLFMVLAVAINIKVSLFAFAGIFCLGYYIWYAIRVFKYKDKKISQNFFWKLTIIATTSVMVGVFIIGLYVYPKNMLVTGNPFYPIVGEGKIDIMTANQPDYFKNKAPIEKFNISVFSEVANIIENTKEEAKYKVPFSIHKGEMYNLSAADTRISGNGIFFSGIFIITIFIIICFAKNILFKDKNKFYLLAIPSVITVFMIFMLDEAWWARYFPQLYFLVLFAIILLEENANMDIYRHKIDTNVAKVEKVRIKKTLLYAFITLILINNAITFCSVVKYAYKNNVQYNIEFAMLEETIKDRSNISDINWKLKSQENKKDTETLEINAGAFHGAKFNIIDKYGDKVNIIFTNNMTDEKLKTLFGGRIKYRWIK